MNGLGEKYLPFLEKKMYEGSFKDGEFDGYGREFDHRFEGYGRERRGYYRDEKKPLRYEGQWSKGCYNGQGIYYAPNSFVG